jgi:hypothetical protein
MMTALQAGNMAINNGNFPMGAPAPMPQLTMGGFNNLQVALATPGQIALHAASSQFASIMHPDPIPV